ncbi:MAG: hypothetical protein OXE53_18935 [Deltaproteobacteria bacterium]|nr:hypothetical protein [Deltaproteobacteria bacterium]
MTPGEVRGKTLAELRRARKNMMSAEWLAGVEDLAEAGRTSAATALLDVCLAIRRLENAGAAEIRRQLADHEQELERGVRGLERAGERLHRIKTYLKAATALAATVGKVVKPL